MIASLIYNTQELVEPLRKQVPGIHLIDVSDEPLKDCNQRYETNLLWAQNWHRFLSEYTSGYVWMLNSDVQGVSEDMYQALITKMKETDAFMITPAFNSPHSVFHKKGNDLREVNWVDMTAPLIDLNKYFELGGFDPNFIGYFGDVDLCYRARKKGFKMYVLDSFEFKHIGSYTVKKHNIWEQADISHNEILLKKYGKSWNELI